VEYKKAHLTEVERRIMCTRVWGEQGQWEGRGCQWVWCAYLTERISSGVLWHNSMNIIKNNTLSDYRPKTNVVILLDMGHTLRGECTWEE
jgi:hypothetical protein